MQKYGFIGAAQEYIVEYQIGAAVPNAGVGLTAATNATAGVNLMTEIAAVDYVGMALDTQATLVTAQQSDNSDPARRVSVIVNSDLILKARLNNGDTEGTALLLFDITTASTDGLDVTTGDAWNASGGFDGGTVWGYDGANAGVARQITAVSATAANPTVAFPFDNSVGDNFMRVPLSPTTVLYPDFTNLFTEINAEAGADTDNVNFFVIGMILNDIGNDGRNHSYALIVPADSIFASNV